MKEDNYIKEKEKYRSSWSSQLLITDPGQLGKFYMHPY